MSSYISQLQEQSSLPYTTSASQMQTPVRPPLHLIKYFHIPRALWALSHFAEDYSVPFLEEETDSER